MAGAEEAEVVVDLQKQNPKLKELPEGIDATVSTLNLSENELKALPASLGALTRLRQLDLSDNLMAALPEELGECSALEELLLYKNQLKKLPAAIGKLKSLRVLVSAPPPLPQRHPEP